MRWNGPACTSRLACRAVPAQLRTGTAGYAPQMPSAYAYLNDPSNGANLSSILGGHTLDLAMSVLGEIAEIDALATIQFRQIHLTDTGASIERSTPDQLLMLSRHDNCCIASIEVGGNRPPSTRFTFKVIGTDGTLSLVGGHLHGFQAGKLTLDTDSGIPPPDVPVAAGLTPEAANVAEVYAHIVGAGKSGDRAYYDRGWSASTPGLSKLWR